MASLSIEDCLVFEPRFIDPSLSTGLWWCETALDVQAVGVNAVALPLAGSWDNLRHCMDWIQQFPYIFVASPSRGLVEEVRQHIPSMPILSPAKRAFGDYGSVSALKAACGPAAVERLLMGAVEEPVLGLLDLSQVSVLDERNVPRTFSGLPELDRKTGGFRAGELSLWTGKRGEGKSTLLGQIMIEAIDQGHKVCVYSGEMRASLFKSWILIQAAGPKYIKSRRDKETGLTMWGVSPHTEELINNWLERHFYLSDIGADSAHDEDHIMDLFSYASRVQGCDVFVVDNIMTAQLQGDRDYYRAQSMFCRRLTRFAKSRGVHVHLVAHPKKLDGRAIADSDDVSGTGDLPNLADNVFVVAQVKPGDPDYGKADSGILIFKNRFVGQKSRLGFRFHIPSRRYYSVKGDPNKEYSWAYAGEQLALAEVTQPDPDMPFEAG